MHEMLSEENESPIQTHESPAFGISIVSPSLISPDYLPRGNPHSQTTSRDKSAILVYRHDSPVDDRTKPGNCGRTFDDFLEPHQLGEDKPAKRMGATWDVVRAIVRLKRPLMKYRRKVDEEKARKAQLVEVDRKRLLSDSP